MDNKLQELLTITMEECGELIQACSKAIRCDQYYDNDNLLEEIRFSTYMISSSALYLENFQVAGIAFGFGATLGFVRRLARIWEQ